MIWGTDKGLYFVYDFTIVPAWLVEKTILYPLNSPGIFAKSWLTIYVWAFSWLCVLPFYLFVYFYINIKLPWWLSAKEFARQCRRCRFDSQQEDHLEKEMTTDSSIFAWEIPRAEEDGHGVPKSQTWLSDLTTTSISNGLDYYKFRICI